MRLKTIKSLKNIKGKRVILRTDFNVSAKSGVISKNDEERIKAAMPTIKYLINQGVKVIIVSHWGRPKGRPDSQYKLDAVGVRLSRFIKKKVVKFDEIYSQSIKQTINGADAGTIFMLENVRFDPGEEANNEIFAKKIASLGDYYVNDAFANCHRQHASMAAITKFLPSFAGLLLEKEINIISRFLRNPQKPFCAIIGGAKISTKLKMVKNLLKNTDNILLGGALANTVLKAQGVAVGRSLVENKMVEELKKINLTNTKIHIPLDVAVGNEISNRSAVSKKAVANVGNNEYILDIGPYTIELFNSIIRRSKTVIWNGPMGMTEYKKSATGTKKLLIELEKSYAEILIGGGDTIKAIKQLCPKLEKKKNVYISTGGGAMLKFFEEKTLVAIKPLII